MESERMQGNGRVLEGPRNEEHTLPPKSQSVVPSVVRQLTTSSRGFVTLLFFTTPALTYPHPSQTCTFTKLKIKVLLKIKF